MKVETATYLHGPASSVSAVNHTQT